jgi:hypothetical protein
MFEMKFKNFIFFTFILSFLSCRETLIQKPVPAFQRSGFFIVNEGRFQSGSGTIDFYDRVKDTVFHHIFQTKNDFPLGNIVQSVYSIGGRYIYVVVNNADKIEIVSQSDFESLHTIENIHFPRYVLSDLNKLYVSAWDNTIKVFALQDSVHPELIKSIHTNTGPEKLLLWNHRLFVLNQGGFGIDSTISVIDTQTDTYLTTIAVAPKPTGAIIDRQNRLWVMCAGKGWEGIPHYDDSQGHLFCLDPLTFEIYHDYIFPEKDTHPIGLAYNKYNNCLYFKYKNAIYQKNVETDSLGLKLFCNIQNVYSLFFDERYRELLVSDPLDYVAKSKVFRVNQNGIIIDSIQTGTVSGNFLINCTE